MKYSINVKYWHDSHDHELFFATWSHAIQIFKALTHIAPNSDSDIEMVALWNNENNQLIACEHF